MDQIQLRKIGFAILYILILFQFEAYLDFGFGYQDPTDNSFTEMISSITVGYRFRWELFFDCLLLRPVLAFITTVFVAFIAKHVANIIDIMFNTSLEEFLQQTIKHSKPTPKQEPKPNQTTIQVLPKQEPKQNVQEKSIKSEDEFNKYLTYLNENIDETTRVRVNTSYGFKNIYKKKVVDPTNPKDMELKAHIDYNRFAVTWVEYYDKIEYVHYDRDWE